MILCDCDCVCVVRRGLGSTDFFHLIVLSPPYRVVPSTPQGSQMTAKTFSSILMATDLKCVRTTYIDSIGSDFTETSKLFLVWSLFDLIYLCVCIYIYIYIFIFSFL